MNDEDLLQDSLPEEVSQTCIKGSTQVWSTKPPLKVTPRYGEPAELARRGGCSGMSGGAPADGLMGRPCWMQALKG